MKYPKVMTMTTDERRKSSIFAKTFPHTPHEYFNMYASSILRMYSSSLLRIL